LDKLKQLPSAVSAMGEVHFLGGVLVYPRRAGGIDLQILLSLLADNLF
jgi:hypothetical protein